MISGPAMCGTHLLAARRYGGYAREAHVGLSTGCARFSEGAKRLTIGEVQLCRRKQSHMRSRGFAVAFRRQPS